MMLKLLIKSGLVVGAVYYTKKVGIWGSTEETEKLYNQIKAELRPRVQTITKQLPFEVPSLPKTDETTFVVNHYYNNGVKSTFRFIYMLPCYTGQMIKKAKTTMEEFAASPSPAAAKPVAATVSAQSDSKK